MRELFLPNLLRANPIQINPKTDPAEPIEVMIEKKKVFVSHDVAKNILLLL